MRFINILSLVVFGLTLTAQTTFTYDANKNITTISEDANCVNNQPPANDDVCSATLLTVDAPCSTHTTENAFSQSGEPECTFGLVNSVWFKFTAPASGKVQVKLSEVANGLDIADTRVGVYTATDCNDFGTFNLMTCAYGETPNLNLSPGTTYYVQVDGYENETGAFCIEVVTNQVFINPNCANDDACDALYIPVGAACTGYIYTNECASGQSGEPNCTSGNHNTVWFKFTAPASGRVRIRAKSPGGTLSSGHTYIGVYSVNDCTDFGSYVQLDCESGETDNLTVTPGETYYIQADGFSDRKGNFCIEIEDCPTPVNDNVSDAIFLSVGEDCIGYPYTNVCSKHEQNEPGCLSGEHNTVWFKFIAPASGTVRVKAKSPGGTLSSGHAHIGVYAATDCNNFNTFTQLDCELGETDNLSVIPGKIYYVQIDGLGTRMGNFCVEIEDCPAPINDNVCNAIPLSVGEPCTGYIYSNQCSQYEASEPGCPSGEYNTVWFKFIAPASGTVRVRAKSPGGTLSSGHTHIGVYAVTDCNDFSSFTQLGCEPEETNNLTVTPGETYYIQIDGLGTRMGNFCVEIEDCPAPINDNVCNAISLSVGEPCTGYIYSNQCSQYEASEPSCTSGEYNTVWFKFIAPASGTVRVRAKSPGGTLSSGHAHIGVYAVTDCNDFSSFTQLGCELGETNNLTVIPGETYYIQIDGLGARTGNFCIEVYENAPPMNNSCSNDDACNAIPLVLGESCTLTNNECASYEMGEPFPSCFYGNSTTEFNSV